MSAAQVSVWTLKGPRAGMFQQLPANEALAAIDAGAAQDPFSGESLRYPENHPLVKSGHAPGPEPSPAVADDDAPDEPITAKTPKNRKNRYQNRELRSED